MKAIVLHEYGGPSKLRYQDFEDPNAGPGEVRIRVLAASVNPVDWKMRSGADKQRFPLQFPAILGHDVAGIVDSLGEGVEGWQVGDRVFGVADRTYAELCVVKACDLSPLPEGLDVPLAGAVPLVALTGDQLIREACEVQAGQTVLLSGATGSVGRCALFAALEIGAKVIAGVRAKQKDEALALGAMAALDIDDPAELASLGRVDAVADTVGGKLGPALLAKVKPGGVYGTLVEPPTGEVTHPLVRLKPIKAQPNPATVVHYGQAVRDGKLRLPVSEVLPLSEAATAHARAEKGGGGKFILLP